MEALSTSFFFSFCGGVNNESLCWMKQKNSGLWNELSVALSLWVAMQVASSAAGVLRIETHVFLMSSSNGMFRNVT